MVNQTSKITFYHFNADECITSEDVSLAQCAVRDHNTHVSWINIVGTDAVTLQQAGEIFKIHPLAIEDIANTRQRAKVDDYEDFLFVVLRMFTLKDDKIENQQVSFILRDNVLVSFREFDFGIFKKVGDKLCSGKGGIRKKGEDHLLYTLLDVIIDNYFFVLEHINEDIEKLDQAILKRPLDNQFVKLQALKNEVLYIRKNIIPVRDLINNLIRNEIEYFEDENKYYLRDLQDHMTRNVEEIDFQREQINSLMDIYYSLQTHKMNNVMKTLTTVSFVLLPLTFIATIYGMNFKYMPRVDDPYGFWEVLGGMGVISLVLLFIAISRNWISTKAFSRDKDSTF
ncbi:MAG TPA: magnesium/cobalt transporter CorA [Chitinophagales bacterium]|nr:magnesium/cobalt transporter CorA [Chitinophagales bacterium]